jgi:hypothetical protein
VLPTSTIAATLPGSRFQRSATMKFSTAGGKLAKMYIRPR